MAVGFGNLDTFVKGLINGNHPDIGQVHYMVDSDYRTAAQGWSRADRTGPLDLYEARKAGPGGVQYVFRTGDYGTDTLAMQAAVDATIDYRGDIVFLTPGTYKPLTSVLIDSPGIRLLGPPVRKVRAARAIIDATGGVTNMLDIPVSTHDVEMGFIQLIPVTVGTAVRMIGSNGLYMHNIFWNTDGVAASTSTKGFVNLTTTSQYPEFTDCEWLADAAQGVALDLTLTDNATVARNRFISDAGTWANVVTTAATTLHAHFDNCYAGGRGAFTNIFTGPTGADQLVISYFVLDGTALATATAIETGYDTTVAIDIAECYITGDATTQGGVLITLA